MVVKLIEWGRLLDGQVAVVVRIELLEDVTNRLLLFEHLFPDATDYLDLSGHDR